MPENLEGYVIATSDNLPSLNVWMLMDFAAKAGKYISAEIRNMKTGRSARESYVDTAVGRVCLKRNNNLCRVKGEVCLEDKHSSSNYEVSLVIDEEADSIVELKCLSCAALQGGCKHALSFLMWVHDESSRPRPTEVVSYWDEPLFIDSNRVLTTSDFGEVPESDAVDVAAFVAKVLAVPARSLFHRYYTELDAIFNLDLYQLALKYAQSRNEVGPFAVHEFREFCRAFLTEEACSAALTATKDQSDSEEWHCLRYGRISSSTIYEAAHSEVDSSSVLKEYILGFSPPRTDDAMQRKLELKSSVIEIIKKEKSLGNVERVGIQLSADLPEFGASPYSLTDDFVVEIKCPQDEEALGNYVSNKTVAKKFMAQMQLQMKMCKKKRGLFCVVHPDFELARKMTVFEVKFDCNLTNELIFKSRQYWDRHIYPVLMEPALK